MLRRAKSLTNMQPNVSFQGKKLLQVWISEKRNNQLKRGDFSVVVLSSKLVLCMWEQQYHTSVWKPSTKMATSKLKRT